jgi:hypothetical protein
MKKYVIVFKERVDVQPDSALYDYTVCNGFNVKDAITAAVTTDKCKKEDIIVVIDAMEIVRQGFGCGC